MRVAIIHEWLSSLGGTERLLIETLKLFPQADVFALIHAAEKFRETPLETLKVKTSFLQKIPFAKNLYRGLLPLMPLAIESFDLSGYDLVLSLSHAVAHGVRTHENQTHISYISTPMRYAWHMKNDYLKLHGLNIPFVHFAANWTLSLLRRWDIAASARSDVLIANSNWTASHIRQAWKRDAQVIYPPVDVERFEPASTRDSFYLLVSRLVPYKMSRKIVNAFNIMGFPLVVVGDGPDLHHLQRIAKENIKLLGYQPDETVTDLMNRAKAFVYMATEDFGIAMAEAQAAGCPVIAYGMGGAKEIIRNGETGLLFNEQTEESLIEAVLRFESMQLNSKAAQENAARFSSQRFREEFSSYIEKSIKG